MNMEFHVHKRWNPTSPFGRLGTFFNVLSGISAMNGNHNACRARMNQKSCSIDGVLCLLMGFVEGGFLGLGEILWRPTHNEHRAHALEPKS